uniref:Uncharacterized protein n=1 Tax=Caenorhabditis japonica TaxID=281687 RepID=A0A8R1E8R0_CAEJA
MTNFVSEAEKLPSRFHTKKHSLKSFGKLFSSFYRVPIPLIDFDLITSTLYNLKSTSIGRSDEVFDLAQSLEHLEDLEYAAICKKKNIAPLLAEADTFFLEFFFLKSNKENWYYISFFAEHIYLQATPSYRYNHICNATRVCSCIVLFVAQDNRRRKTH